MPRTMNSLYQIALYDGDRFITVANPRNTERSSGHIRLELDLEPIDVIHVTPPLLQQCPFGPANQKPPPNETKEMQT